MHARPATFRLGYRRHDAREVTIVSEPEIDEVSPVRVCVSLCFDPRVLVVSGEDEIIQLRSPHEPLVVHAGRVDQVTQHLFR